MPFFIIFVCIPLAEVLVFIMVSGKIGLATALLMALITAILGGFLVKYQGMKTFFAAQQALNKGEIPSKELFDGLCLVAAGATLITPGFITDTIGFLLLIPKVRDALRQKLMNSGKFKAEYFHTEFTGFEEAQPRNYRQNDGNIIDVEYETMDNDDKT